MSKFSNFSVYGTALFFVFLIVMTILISTYPGGFFKNKNISTSVMILLLLVCVIWVSLLSVFLFPEISNNAVDNSKTNVFKRALLFLFGIIISGLVIFWIVYNIQNLSGDSSIVSFILNILIVILVLIFVIFSYLLIISIKLICPGFVKLHIPVSLFSII